MLDKDIEGLRPLHGKPYQDARAAFLRQHAATLAREAPPAPTAPPDLRNALYLWAKEPEKARRFSGALEGTNREFLNPKGHATEPTADQIGQFLVAFGPAYLPLAEEFLFQMEHRLSANSARGAAIYYQGTDPKRGEQVIAACFAAYAGKPHAQLHLIGAVELIALAGSRSALWQAYRESGHTVLRHASQFLLAKSGDKEMKAAIEAQLASPDTDAADRESAINAYLNYLTGESFDKLVHVYRGFPQPKTRLETAALLLPYGKDEAAKLEKLIRETREKDVQAKLQENLDDYKARNP